MNLRIIVSPLFLLLLLALLSPAYAQEKSADVDRDAWITRFTTIVANSSEGVRTVQEFLQLPPDTGYAILQQAWTQIPGVDTKQFILTLLEQNGHPRLLDMLNMGADDPSVPVQNRALQLMEGFSFRSFVEDYNVYLQWREQAKGKSIETLMRDSMRSVSADLAKAGPLERRSLLSVLVHVNFTAYSKLSRTRREVALAEGLPDALAHCFDDPNYLWMAFQILRNLRPDEATMRRVVLPLTDKKTDPTLRFQAFYALATPENAWASKVLLKMLLDEYPDPGAETIAMTLAQTGDPQAIPTMIAMMDADNTPEGNRVLGNALSLLTGVNSGFVRDAQWWHDWWKRNNLRFPKEVQTAPFPKVALHPRPAPAMQPGVNGGVRSGPPRPEQRQIAEDPKRAYWLITPSRALNAAELKRGAALPLPAGGRLRTVVQIDAPPPPPRFEAKKAIPAARENPAGDLPGLLVVLTQDGDGASRVSFWQDAAEKALKGRYYIAVAVAPKWELNQPLVWLTRSQLKTVKEAKFPTETFVADIVKDVAGQHKIDAERVFLHGVGAGGLAVYACSLEETTPFKGFSILSAAFKSSQLPALKNAKGRRYYIQNSQDDKVNPYWMAAAAQKLLNEQGATVKLVPNGGYNDPKNTAPWASLADTFQWLEAAK